MFVIQYSEGEFSGCHASPVWSVGNKVVRVGSKVSGGGVFSADYEGQEAHYIAASDKSRLPLSQY